MSYLQPPRPPEPSVGWAELRGLVWPSSLLASARSAAARRPLPPLFSTALTPSWNDRCECDAEVRCTATGW